MPVGDKGVDLSQATPVDVQRLERKFDIRSIDPVVDVTNYVMIELGHRCMPLNLARSEVAFAWRMAAGQ